MGSGVYYTHETPEGQWHYGPVLTKQIEVLDLLEAEGLRQKDIAKKLRVSQSRVHQLIQTAKKNRARGLI